MNDSGDAALARKDKVIDRLAAEVKEMKGASKEISKNMKLMLKSNNRNEDKLNRIRNVEYTNLCTNTW